MTGAVYRSERIQSIGSDRSLAVGPQHDLYMGTRSHELAVGRSGSQGLSKVLITVVKKVK